jgi:regulator of vacuolar morphogenesis
MATAADKDGLFKGSSGGSGGRSGAGGIGRRVLGAPLKETERTRELDNEGVLQLQRQIIAEQDQDVTDITAVVRKMREMGVQINEELVLQNEMMGLLDRDIDRNAAKIAVAKKRVGRIS